MTELLASEQMASLLRELASRVFRPHHYFRFAALLATTEARVLATHMGQILMVVAADQRPARGQAGARDDRKLRCRIDDAQQGGPDGRRNLLWVLRGRCRALASGARGGTPNIVPADLA